MATWLVTGGTGLLGAACVRRARDAGHTVVATMWSHGGLDVPGVQWRKVNLEDESETDALMREVHPSVVIHTAAMAQPGECELDKARATTINTQCPAWLSSACARQQARMLHLSTDLVFSGDAGPYVEDDAVAPISHYGATKVEAEREVRRNCPDHVIVRTSLILGPSPRLDRGADEVLANSVRAGKKARLFVDEFRSPIAADDLAAILVALGGHPYRGTLHVAGAEAVSRSTLGTLVGLAYGLDLRQLTADTVRNAADLHPPRAPNTVLDIRRLRALQPALPTTRALSEVLLAHPWAAGTLRGLPR